MAKKILKGFALTKQRLAIAQKLADGEELLLTRGFNRKTKVGFKSGKPINEDVADGMLKAGCFVPLDDGLFAGGGQTLVLSSTYKAQIEKQLEIK